MSHLLDQWEASGQRVSIGDYRVFYRDAGEGGEACVVLHGFPTHSSDFHRVAPLLEDRVPRIVFHDHLGFGLSDKPRPARLDRKDKEWGEGRRYSYSLIEQAEVAVQLWHELGLERVHIIAHDYGTSVATEILARRQTLGLPLEIASVTLGNGSVHLELADITLIQVALKSRVFGPLVARLSTEAVFRNRIQNTFALPVADEDVDAMWAGLVRADGRSRIPAISRYLDERMRFWHRWIGALRQLDVPAHVVWGKEDPIAVAAIAERLAAEIPSAQLTWLETSGHYPMLEAPDEWANAVFDFLQPRIDGS